MDPSRYIATAFKQQANEETIHYEFDISGGEMENRNPNTTFSFDTQPDTLLDELKILLFGEELAKISKTQEKNFEIKESNFYKKVSEYLIEYFGDTIRSIIGPLVFRENYDVTLMSLSE